MSWVFFYIFEFNTRLRDAVALIILSYKYANVTVQFPLQYIHSIKYTERMDADFSIGFQIRIPCVQNQTVIWIFADLLACLVGWICSWSTVNYKNTKKQLFCGIM